MKNVDNYEIKNLRFGEFCVVIEFCSDCSQHSSSLRHDEQKYLNKALEIKNFIQNEFSFMKIYLKPLQAQIKQNVKKLGLFEVYFAGYNYKQFQLIASKLTTLKWPSPQTVVNNIRQHFDGKCIDIQLQVQDLFFFHPENQFLNDIKTVLTTSLDYQKVLQKYQKIPKKRKISSKQNFKKQRKLSSIVQSKIKSGFLNEDTVNSLMDNKRYCVEKIPDQNMNVQFVNVKPGKYKFMILESKNLQFCCYDIFVQPYIRKNDERQSFQANLQIVDKGILGLQIEFEEENPIIQIQIRPREDQISQSFNSSEISTNFIDIFLTDTLQKDGKCIACFQSKDLTPGIYDFYVEYKNYEVFQQEIFIFQGQNLYQLQYPYLSINYDFRQDEQLVNTLMQQQDYSKMMPTIMENPKIENRSYCSQTKKSFMFQRDSNAKSKIEFTNEKQNKQQESQLISKRSTKSEKNSDNKENYTNSRSQIMEKQPIQKQSLQNISVQKQNESDFEKDSFESKSNKSSRKSKSKSSISSKSSKSNSSKSFSKSSQKKKNKNILNEKSSIDNVQNSKNSEKQQENNSFKNSQKQRIASGNKIRPGERLYSAKSTNLNYPQAGETPKKQIKVTKEKASEFKDGTWENLTYNKSQFQIFMQENSQIELGMDFIVEVEDVNQQNFMEEDQQNNYQKISLNFINEFHLGRIFLKKVDQYIQEDIQIYIQCDGFVEKIKLTEFLNQYSNEKDNFCDLCILTKDIQFKKFKTNLFLVPMQEPLLSTTGLFEIKKLVDFVTNSKFTVSRFFGFDLDFEQEQSQKKDFTIQEKEALECLKNYEIYCNTNYILNSIKYDKKGNLSLRRLEKLYPKWKLMIEDIGDLLVEIQEGQNQSEDEDEFDVDEFEEYRYKRQQQKPKEIYGKERGYFRQRYNNENQFESFVDEENQDYFDIQEQQKLRKAECQGKRNEIIHNNDEIVDSEVVECNWYAQGFLKDVHILLQNVNNNMSITEPEIDSHNKATNQIFYFPTYTQIDHIYIYKNNHKHNTLIYGFKFKFYNGEQQIIQCKDANDKRSKTIRGQTFDINESIAGVTYGKRDGLINDIQFHVNTLKAEQNWGTQKLTYVKIAQNYELIHRVDKDQLESEKIFGIKKGKQFTDKDFNDSWVLTKIIVKYNGSRLNKIQTFLKQKYFDLEVQNEEHKCIQTINDRDYKEKVIIFPESAELTKIEFQMNHRHVCGLVFYFDNGTQQEIKCEHQSNIKAVKFSNKQVFLGFNGYKDERYINSLGVLERYESRDFIAKWGVN